MISPSSEFLTALVNACSVGTTYDSAASEKLESFDEHLVKCLTDRLDTSDQVALRALRECGRQGLMEARAGNDEASEKHFSEAWQLLHTSDLGVEALLLGESLLNAQIAYNWYRQRKYKKALKLLERSFRNDLILEMQMTYEILRIHRIQLLNNLMRMYTRQGQFATALTIGNAILTYLELPEVEALSKLSTPWNEGWSNGLSAIPISLIRDMHHQVAAEQVNALRLCVERHGTKNDLTRILANIRNEWNASQAYLWTSFHLTLLDRSVGDPLIFACDILRRGKKPSEPLWRSVLEATKDLLEEIELHIPE